MKQYSIVSYLEGHDKEKIRLIQKDLSRLTGSRECLDNWSPHITVGNGISTDENSLKTAEGLLNDLAEKTKPFDVLAEGFGGLTNRKGGISETTTPYVLWVDVVVNDELQDFVERVRAYVTSQFELWYHMPLPYQPHVTLAFRDLTKEGYEAGKEYLSNLDFHMTTRIHNVALVEKTSTKDIEYKRFSF